MSSIMRWRSGLIGLVDSRMGLSPVLWVGCVATTTSTQERPILQIRSLLALPLPTARAVRPSDPNCHPTVSNPIVRLATLNGQFKRLRYRSKSETAIQEALCRGSLASSKSGTPTNLSAHVLPEAPLHGRVTPRVHVGGVQRVGTNCPSMQTGVYTATWCRSIYGNTQPR